ncbi:hypothetical protein A2127_01015 [Candidatus Jorgensenbacteria bacterium GWC1_48_12]|uniref:Uncharacterized protein n=1 Tax=Candidatus Jorgensenbacteria bacterium GWC1_48_12 TaxID=1798469 RepID=A0A1F6BLX8_9BACT|nr:MAG: hypothetical protein A2127_01015 [Candidatus Jorgensenbacteria bacterium GWC1_48_12]
MLEMTYEGFARAVEERAKQSSFLIALCQTLDEYQAFEHGQGPEQPACCKSCSFCCHQMVCVFPAEMEEIHTHIMRQVSPVRRRLREKIHKAAKEWRAYFEKHRFSPARIQHPLRVAEDWFGKPCPLLQEDGSCGVYEARPLVCRTTTSPTRCTEPAHLKDGKHSAQMRYICEEWANRLFMEEMWRLGAQGVTPMPHFFGMQQFKV